jgi:signal transduction histidine kinase
LLVVLVLHLLILVTLLFRLGDDGRPDTLVAQSYFLLGLSFLAAVASFLRDKKSTLLVLLQFLLALVLTYPLDKLVELKYLCACLILFQTVAYFDKFWWFAFLYLEGFAVVFVLHQVPAWGDPVVPLSWMHLLYLEALGVGLILLVRRFQVHQKTVNRLKNQILDLQTSIIDVYQLNHRYQDFALVVRERTGLDERRVTRDVHDILGYTLVNLRVFFEMALDLSSAGQTKLRELLTQGLEQCQAGLEKARQVLRTMRMPETHVPLWMQSVDRLAKNFQEVTKIKIDTHWGNAADRYPEPIQDFLIKFVQEAMTNSFRHGSATSITISFWTEEGTLVARVLDNGHGSNLIVPGIGFTGMQERIEALAGHLEFGALKNGFLVEAHLPVGGAA